MGRRQQQQPLVSNDDSNNERPFLGDGGAGGGSESLPPPPPPPPPPRQRRERALSAASATAASSTTRSSTSSRRQLSFTAPRRTRSSDSNGALTVSTASLDEYYSDDDFDLEEWMGTTERMDDDDDEDLVDVRNVVDIDLAGAAAGDSYDSYDNLHVWGQTIQVEAPCALPEGYVFTVDATNGQQLLVEVPACGGGGGVVEGQWFDAVIVHVVDETNNDVDYERMYNLDPATRTSQLQQHQQESAKPKSSSTSSHPQVQKPNEKKHKTTAAPQRRRSSIPRGAWRNGLFSCFQHGLFQPILCFACWCWCSPLLLGRVLVRLKLDACGNTIAKQLTNADNTDDKLHQSTNKTSPLPFWRNAFYTMAILLTLHVVLMEHVLSAFIMYCLNGHYYQDQDHKHPTWLWMLLCIRATCRCSFFVYMICVTIQARRRMRQKYQIPNAAYCRSIRGAMVGCLTSFCRWPCRRRRHVYSKQNVVTAASEDIDGVVLVDNNIDAQHDGACEDCMVAIFCNCCTIMQMARHTADNTSSSRATYCAPSGL